MLCAPKRFICSKPATAQQKLSNNLPTALARSPSHCLNQDVGQIVTDESQHTSKKLFAGCQPSGLCLNRQTARQ
ncbi:hypothetical protein EMIT0215P_20403 [Pseudomonas serboccidentalis]